MLIADHSKKTLFDVVEGRTIAELKNKLEGRAGRENVKFFTMAPIHHLPFGGKGSLSQYADRG